MEFFQFMSRVVEYIIQDILELAGIEAYVNSRDITKRDIYNAITNDSELKRSFYKHLWILYEPRLPKQIFIRLSKQFSNGLKVSSKAIGFVHKTVEMEMSTLLHHAKRIAELRKFDNPFSNAIITESDFSVAFQSSQR
jgi:hypothetical protein